jgi:hypothetical protein
VVQQPCWTIWGISASLRRMIEDINEVGDEDTGGVVRLKINGNNEKG